MLSLVPAATEYPAPLYRWDPQGAGPNARGRTRGDPGGELVGSELIESDLATKASSPHFSSLPTRRRGFGHTMVPRPGAWGPLDRAASVTLAGEASSKCAYRP